MKAESRVVIVTGGSSGIGRATAEALLGAGCRVYEFSRHDAGHRDVCHMGVDVTDESTVNAAVAAVLEREGHIDLVVNCAGFGISGAVEFTATHDARRQLEVNFFGLVHVNRAVLPYMRQAGKGRIVNISSVAAPAAIPFQAYYSASKAAINAYTCALANEVRPYGVTVTAVMPGDIATGFTDAREKTVAGDGEYGGRISRSVAKMERDERRGMTAEQAGRRICRIALKKKVKPLYAVGFTYQCICVLCRLLPCGVLNRLIGRLYAN